MCGAVGRAVSSAVRIQSSTILFTFLDFLNLYQKVKKRKRDWNCPIFYKNITTVIHLPALSMVRWVIVRLPSCVALPTTKKIVERDSRQGENDRQAIL